MLKKYILKIGYKFVYRLLFLVYIGIMNCKFSLGGVTRGQKYSERKGKDCV